MNDLNKPSQPSSLNLDIPLPATPPARPTERKIWGETVIDDYSWLRDGEDPEVLAHLEAENAFTAEVLAPTRELQETIFGEIKSRVKETDLSVPVVKDGWSYYSRSEEGQEYGIHCRRRIADDGTEGDEQVFFDENLEAEANKSSEKGPDYFEIGVFEVSPDHKLLLWGDDRTGEEFYDIRVRDLETNQDLEDLLPRCSAGSAWAMDNSTFFYLRLDDSHRPYQVWRHELGTPAEDDVLVFEEPDERFWCGVGRDRDDSFIQIGSSSTLSDEVWLIPAGEPTAEPVCVQPRTTDLEYGLSHHEDRFIVITNDEAQNFKLMTVADAVGAADSASTGGLGVSNELGRSNWQPLIPHRSDVMLTGFEVLTEFLILFERAEGLTRFSFARWEDLGEDAQANLRAFQTIEQQESVYSVWPGANPTPDTTLFRYGYTSMVTPSALFTLDLKTGERTLLKQQEVLGDFDPSKYETWREWATSEDGTKIPLSLVARKDRASLIPPGTNGPAVVGAYGAYEISQDPGFSVARLSMLDRGYVTVLVHARGGGELGRQWYEGAKFESKKNTFLDVVAAGEHIVANKIADSAQMALRGGSAGGLMAGAVMNLAPELFASVAAQVPFVDIINTMLDASLPLTVAEWEEWGDPASSESIYQAMRGYAPLENVTKSNYPAVYATAGLHDPRVGFWEPAKWVLALRKNSTSGAPILLKTEMGAGHGGPTGRYEEWRDEARTLAFLLVTTQI